MSDPTRVRHALKADLVALSDTLASAFADDPVMKWIYDDPAMRPAHVQRWMRFNLEIGLVRGHLYTTDDRRAAAIWAPPDVTLFDAVTGPAMGKLISEMVGDRAADVLKALAQVITVQGPDEPHFYLFVLGTHRDAQNQGLGARLLEPVLSLCDAQGLGAHLESSNARNLPFYERHGFEVTNEVSLTDAGPVLHLMWRKPRCP